jgi:hypothetical protein
VCNTTLPDARHDLHTLALCFVSLPYRHVTHTALLSAPCSLPSDLPHRERWWPSSQHSHEARGVIVPGCTSTV